MKKDEAVAKLLEARGKIDAKLAEYGHAPGPSDDRIQQQLTALSTKIDALASRSINITVPERSVTVNNNPPSADDLEVKGPGGTMSVRRIRRVV